MPGDGSLIYCHNIIIPMCQALQLIEFISLEDLLEGKNSQGMTPLFQAVSCNNLECIQYLVTSGANIDTRDNVGRTPVALAAYQVRYMYVCNSAVLFCFPLLLL